MSKVSHDINRQPDPNTLHHACKLSILEDKPIMMDYWLTSLNGKSIIGVTDNQDKYLIKSEDEFTSTIVKLYKSGTEYIVATENSIYIIDLNITTKKITQLKKMSK
jgi:hypothetical protein